MATTDPTICIVGTHHAYQYQTRRQSYFQNIRTLIEIHSADLVAEEATGVSKTYARTIADEKGIAWKNVDLTTEERQHVTDLNPLRFC
jgi:hypothetical protein